jgi:hypothetical protein
MYVAKPQTGVGHFVEGFESSRILLLENPGLLEDGREPEQQILFAGPGAGSTARPTVR